MTYPSDKKVPNSNITDCKNTLYPDLHAVFRQLNLSRYAEGTEIKGPSPFDALGRSGTEFSVPK